jgi:hypothetical protein
VGAPPWLALGLDLRLTSTADGGRRRPLGVDGYRRFEYRADWHLPAMEPDTQAGAPVVCFGRTPIGPGERTRAVIVPLLVDVWRQVQPGDELQMCEGRRVCGHATVVWVAPTTLPLSDVDEQRFRRWAAAETA